MNSPRFKHQTLCKHKNKLVFAISFGWMWIISTIFSGMKPTLDSSRLVGPIHNESPFDYCFGIGKDNKQSNKQTVALTRTPFIGVTIFCHMCVMRSILAWSFDASASWSISIDPINVYSIRCSESNIGKHWSAWGSPNSLIPPSIWQTWTLVLVWCCVHLRLCII